MRALFDDSSAKAKTGQNVIGTNKYFSANRATLSYQHHAQDLQKAQKGVKKFVKQTIQKYKQVNLFESVLKNAIQTSPARVQQFNLNQVSQYYPWLFSDALLVHPVPQILFSIKYGIEDSDQYQKISQYEEPGQINKIAYEAVKQSLKNGASYTSALVRILQDKPNFFQKTRFKIDALIDGISGLSDSMIQKAKQAKNAVWSFFSAHDLKGDDGTKKTANLRTAARFLAQIYVQLFSQLRVYGDLIINYGFLKQCAKKRLIDGKLYYNYLQTPNFFIGNSDSIPTVYILGNDGRLQLIPEKQFNLDYFRKLTSLKVVKLSGQIFNQYKKQLNQTADQKTNLTTFKTNYLT